MGGAYPDSPETVERENASATESTADAAPGRVGRLIRNELPHRPLLDHPG